MKREVLLIFLMAVGLLTGAAESIVKMSGWRKP